MIKLYLNGGNDAERIFILNMLPEIIKDITKTVGGIDIDRLRSSIRAMAAAWRPRPTSCRRR